MVRASDIVSKHRFGAPPDAADHPSEVLRKIHELSKPAAPAGKREITPREREIYLAALEMIDDEAKGKKAALARAESAEQELAGYKGGKVVPGAPVSFRVNVGPPDAAGDLRTLNMISSDETLVPSYRVNVVGRNGAGGLRALEVIPLARTGAT